jgi:hypothetical protein
MMFLGGLQPLPDDVHLGRRRLDALLRFLLEGVEHVDGTGKLHRVDGPIRVPVVVLDHFEHPRPTEALPDLRIPMLAAELGLPEGKAHRLANFPRELSQVIPARADPEEWL